MIDPQALLADARQVTDLLVDDLRTRTDDHDETRIAVRGVYEHAASVGRTDRSWEDWREDLLAQVASGWTLASVFVRFCEDNRLVETPLLSGPEHRRSIARDHRAAFLAANPTADDRHWLVEVFDRYRKLPGIGTVLGERNPLWQIQPGPDGAKALLQLWWRTDDEGRRLRHDFTDAQLGTRFLGDLYQDLSEHARKQYALLQTPEFVESFILDRTLDPAIETFGLDEVRMIDPTCGSGHFLLGAFDRLMHRWQEREPHTPAAALAQRALEAVHGVDINSFAVAIARFRLLVAALKAAEIGRLEDAPDFHINVASGDCLLHGTHGGRLFPAEDLQQVVAHHYPTEDVHDAGRILQADHYHCVVGNPPYISSKDPAATRFYRTLYPETAFREFQLTAPMTERFFDLAQHGGPGAGYVGLIVGNAFMTRQFGKPLVERFLAQRELTAVVDTSGAYIPGHGTPTVILCGRDRHPASGHTVRAVLGIRGEPSRPAEPAKGLVWTAIERQVDDAGSESEYVSVEDFQQTRFAAHPWSLRGGYAGRLKEQLEAGRTRLATLIKLAGYTGQTNADPVFIGDAAAFKRRQVERESWRALMIGESIRDWHGNEDVAVIFPYDVERRSLQDVGSRPGLLHWMWPSRTVLWARRTFNKQSYRDEGRPWWEWHQAALDRVATPSIMFAFVATHNHFVLDRGGKVFNRSAPVIKLPEGASEDDHLAMLGLLNSSTACFWMKQVFHNKSKTASGTGGNVDEEWEQFHEFDSTKLKEFPIPVASPLRRAQQLDRLVQELADVLPAAVAERQPPTATALRDAASEAETLRHRMVALQEELDWECYRLYGLLDDDLAFLSEELPPIRKGERAFEIALARRVAAGEATTSWFERHCSTPITEVPAHWPEDYRQLIERRLELIEADRAIKLLERPEYKRRWNWDIYDDLVKDAQEQWLLDRLESWASAADGEDPQLTTVGRLADRLSADAEARQVAQDLAGVGADLVKLVDRLVRSAGAPYLAAYRLKPSGLRKRAAWERTWELQRAEDAIDVRTALPDDHPEHLAEAEATVARKEAGVERIRVPPKYSSSDYRDTTTWRLRGKLDVPKERFVLYPDTRIGADATLVVGWAGWDHLEQARALAGLYTARSRDGAERGERARLLAGIAELVPWLKQWHDEPDPVYGERMGQTFDGFVTAECAALGLTRDDLAGETPLTLDR
jgi:hypothetical protein